MLHIVYLIERGRPAEAMQTAMAALEEPAPPSSLPPLGRDRPMRMGDISGEAATFATMLVWNEARFDYDRVVDCAHGRDARAEFLALHDPPMVIVVNVRRGNRPALRPGDAVE